MANKNGGGSQDSQNIYSQLTEATDFVVSNIKTIKEILSSFSRLVFTIGFLALINRCQNPSCDIS